MSELGDRQARVLEGIRDAKRISPAMLDDAIAMIKATREEAANGTQAGGAQPPAGRESHEGMGPTGDQT